MGANAMAAVGDVGAPPSLLALALCSSLSEFLGLLAAVGDGKMW